jgi:hypothetical protein
MARLPALLAFLAAPAVLRAQTTIVDASGRVVAMMYSGEETAIRTNLVLPTPGWQRTLGLPAADRVTATRTDTTATFKGAIELDASHRLDFTEVVREAEGKTLLWLEYSAAADLAVEGLYFRIDLPWGDFQSGASWMDDPSRSVVLPAVAPANPNLLSGTTAGLWAVNAGGGLRWSARLDRPLFVNLQDKSNENPKAYTFWVYLARGTMPAGTRGSVQVELAVSGTPDTAPAHLGIDPAASRYQFHGFGGNYCFQTDSPVARYTLDNLAVRWARVEMSLDEWEPVNDNASPFDTDWGVFIARDQPASKLRYQLEMARELQRRGIPYIISVWRLPEWMYADRGQRNPSDGARKVDPALWDELLESIGAYLLWLRGRYGAEPDLFSFNEANIGVNVLLTAAEHGEAIRSIGAHLERLGLRTRMLLGDVNHPRGSEGYVLPASQDPEAMHYVGALAFHSWGGATPEQYGAWGDLAERLGLPLLVAELGTDASGWRGRTYDSYWYGMGEVRMYQELLLYARPQATLYWEFTADYSLVRTSPNASGGTDLQPTGRFWLTKQFTDLTPPDSEAVATSSDHPKVLFTAFRKDDRLTLHIANLGAARPAVVQGLPEAAAVAGGVRTTESAGYAEFTPAAPQAGVLAVELPARSLVTLTVSF